MAEEIRVTPTPIQRNLNDVAMELTQLYIDGQTRGATTKEIQDAYKAFYAIARNCVSMDFETSKRVLEE